MKAKILLLLIVGFVFYLYSCESKFEEETEKPFSGAFTAEDLGRIDFLMTLMLDSVVTEFDVYYNSFKEAGDRSSSGHSFYHNRYNSYINNEEYACLLNYCKPFGKTIYPLVFNKIEYVLPTIHLLQGLAGGSPDCLGPYKDVGLRYSHDQEILASYCKQFLDREYEIIIIAILEYFH